MNMSDQQQKLFEQEFQRKQVEDMIMMYNKLSQNCFESCCNEFTSRALTKKEENCVNMCIGKFFQATQRIGLRFQEAQQTMIAGKQQ
eukprot:m.29000 g.29000  ORF g.29000 m.29000 type:complete len:87 (+) comp9529_c0_seq2:52-312(+)